jgi:hypothetical protein
LMAALKKNFSPKEAAELTLGQANRLVALLGGSDHQISTGLGGGKGREIQGFCGVDGLRGPEVFLIPVLAAGGWIRE